MKLLQKDVYIIAISNTAGEDCVLESQILRNTRRYKRNLLKFATSLKLLFGMVLLL